MDSFKSSNSSNRETYCIVEWNNRIRPIFQKKGKEWNFFDFKTQKQQKYTQKGWWVDYGKSASSFIAFIFKKLVFSHKTKTIPVEKMRWKKDGHKRKTIFVFHIFFGWGKGK